MVDEENWVNNAAVGGGQGLLGEQGPCAGLGKLGEQSRGGGRGNFGKKGRIGGRSHGMGKAVAMDNTKQARS